MISLAKERLHIRERQLFLFWRHSKEGLELLRVNPRDPAIEEARDDLDVLVELTEWPLLRDAARKTYAGLDAQRLNKTAVA